ncbi:MAG TPA: PRC-barrel domain-containing protein, partial [Allosphingosinicella sp.]|nr:PRC-barrel domain-containing protein [Allosphingosinicella sp.]
YDVATGRRTYGGREEEFERRDGGRGSGMFRSPDRDDMGHSGREGHAGPWTAERENFSWGKGRSHGDHDNGRHMGGGHRAGEHAMRGRHDQGERMSSGWGPPAGEVFRGGGRGDHERDHHRMEHRGRMERDHRMEHRGHEQRMEHRGREHPGDGGYGSDDRRSGLPIDETSRLIASNKVEGTAVYGSDGSRLGSIFNFMVDKFSGKVEYAVMSYGGMLGMGQRYFPLPWKILSYDTRQGGYRIQMTERDLKDAPSFDRNSEPDFDDNYGERVHNWYGLDY